MVTMGIAPVKVVHIIYTYLKGHAPFEAALGHRTQTAWRLFDAASFTRGKRPEFPKWKYVQHVVVTVLM